MLSELWADYAERREQGGALRANLWLVKEGRSLVAAYRNANRQDTPSVIRIKLMVDLTQTFRSAIHHRGYVALSLITLMLAVGVNLVVFTFANALWLRPRALADAGSIAVIMSPIGGNAGSGDTSFFTDLYLDQPLRTSNAFDGVAGQVLTSGAFSDFLPRVTFEANAEPMETIAVTWQYFSVLGVRPIGRDFGPADDRAGAEPTAIISDRLWKRAFGGRLEILNTIVKATPRPVRVIGIAPSGFQGARLGEEADVWLPSHLVPLFASFPSDSLSQALIPYAAIARLRPGMTPEAAANAVLRASGRRERLPPRVIPITSVFGSPNHRTVVFADSTLVGIVGGTATLVLVGGCATLMALVLVHYERRRQEFGVRLALGASRWQLLRQLAWELGILAAIGGACAFGLAALLLKALPALSLPGGVDLGRLNLGMDWRVVLASLLMSAIALFAGALLPMARGSSGNVAVSLVSARATDSASSMRLRKLALSLHVAATIVILVAAGLFVRSVLYATGEGSGFDTGHTLFIDMQVGPQNVGNSKEADSIVATRAASEHQLVDALRAQPGVQSVAVGNAPLGPDRDWELQRDRILNAGDTQYSLRLGVSHIGAGYLSALGVPLLAGRFLTDADITQDGSGPAVLTASLASTLWPGQLALGRQFQYYSQEHTVVGLIPDIAYGSLSSVHHPVLFMPTRIEALAAGMHLGLTVRAENPEILAEPARRVANAAFPSAARLDVATGHEIVSRNVARERLGAWFFSGFGMVALALGVGSVFGLVAYMAEARRREFGVRMALGAEPSALARTTIVTGVAPVAIGVLFGLCGAAVVARATGSLLVGVGTLDPLSYGAAAALMLSIAVAAGAAAAVRIRRLAPIDALRVD